MVLRGRNIHDLSAIFIPFTAQTRMSGVNLVERKFAKALSMQLRICTKIWGGVLPPA